MLETDHDEIPMVAAIPMVEVELEHCIVIHSESLVSNNNEDEATGSSDRPPAAGHPTTSSTVGGRVTMSTNSTAQSNAALDERETETEAVVNPEEPPAAVRLASVVASPEPFQQPTQNNNVERPVSSPSITAIATPEPTWHCRHLSNPERIIHHDNCQIESLEAATTSSPNFSATTTPQPTQGEPVLYYHDSQPQSSPLPLNMDLLASPAPSMVVTDERRELPPISSFVGKWRTSLCACFRCNLWCTSLPWVSFCCQSILIAQLMTRLRLNWCGFPDNEGFVRTFGILVSITFAFLIVLATGVGFVVWPFFTLWILVLGTRVRAILRKHYRIPARYCFPNTCNGLLEDVCCMICCSCCATIQMAQQTHDDKQYPYECFSPTGLPTHAPGVETIGLSG
jgi:PLAC8 family